MDTRTLLCAAAPLLAALLGSPVASAQRLVADIDPSTTSASSAPEQFVPSGASLFFAARTGLGQELWVSHGSPASTRQVLDIWSGRNSGLPTGIIDLDGLGRVFFSAQDAEGGREPWVSDGTAAGTFRLADLRPGPDGSDPHTPFRVGGLVFFGADDGVHGRELWVTDGSAVGTRMVVDLQPGPGSGYVQGGAAAGAVAVFMGDDGVRGGEPFGADGSPGLAWLLADTEPGAPGASINRFQSIGNEVYLAAYVSPRGSSIWKTGGLPGNTTRVFDLFPQSTGPVGWVGAWSGRYFFTTQQDLYVSGGTPATTRRLSPPVALQNPAHFAPTSGGMFFTALSSGTGRELWTSDGTDTGTRLVAEVWRGSGNGVRNAPAALGGRVVFQGDDGRSGREPWISDGTVAGTQRLRDVTPGAGRSNPEDFVAWPALGAVVFSAFDVGVGDEPWITDGTTSGTQLLADVRPPAGVGSGCQSLTALGDDLLFFASEPGSGTELWRARAGAGATRLEDHFPGSTGSQPRMLGAWRGAVYYSALTPAGWRLFRTDGGAGSATVLANLEAAFEGVEVGGRLLFSAAPAGAATDRELWATDGTVAGTARVIDLNPSRGGYPQLLTKVGEVLVFVATDGSSGLELWRSDGTAAGTVQIADLAPGSGSISVQNPTVVGDQMFFDVDVGVSGRELWATDGTTAGTRLVRDIRPGAASSGPANLVAWRGALWFTADDGATGRELWTSDGTAAGTVQVADLRPGPQSSSPGWFAPTADLLFFVATDGTGTELWTSDSTAAGTRRLRNIRIGPESSGISGLTAVGAGNTVLFSADDGRGADQELWTSDGTFAGTRRLGDLNPEGDARPRSFTVAGRSVWFLAATEATGEEPWELDAALFGASLTEPFGVGCAGSRGIPLLRAAGAPRVGANDFAGVVSSAVPGGFAGLLVGVSAVQLAVGGGCELLVGGAPAFLVAPVAADGTATLGLAIPPLPALAGLNLWLQGVTVDPAGPIAGGYALTQGLRVLVGTR